MKKIEKRKNLSVLGYVISIGGMLLAAFSYFFLEINIFFVGLRGALGLNETIWGFIGGLLWLFIIMAILTPIIVKVGIKTSE